MMRPKLWVGLCAAVVLMMARSGALGAEPASDRCVILLSLDGLANFYLDDPKAEMPTLRRLAREGAVAEGGVVSSFPTVTWPNHTTMVTGVPPIKHGVLGNYIFDRTTGDKVGLILDPVLDKDEVVRVPTVYDAAHEAGLKTAGLIWPSTRSSKSLDWTVPDMGRNDAWAKYGTTPWLAELKAEGLPIDKYEEWFRHNGGAERDWLTVHMAEQLIDKHHPNLLLVHLIEVDHQEHLHGPRSEEAYAAIKLVDEQLASLLAAVDKSPFKGKTTFIVCSDHGFFPVEQQIYPNVLLRQLGFIDTDGKEIKQKSAWCQSQSGSAAVYVLDDAHREEITSKLRDQLARLKGVDKVYGPEEFEQLGQPTRAQDPRYGADLWLSAKSGYSFDEDFLGDDLLAPATRIVGTHGYSPDQPDMLAACVLWGPGIESGTKLGKIKMEDIAPTVIDLLDLKFPKVDGQSLLLEHR